MKKFNENLFEKLVKATQSQLLAFLPSELKKRGMNDIVATKDYILCHGDAPVLLVAHLDTVHRETVKEIYKVGGAWSSPQGIGGDDRCGIYMILSLLEKLPFKPYVLFATDEEIGCVGTGKFLRQYPVNEFEIKFMIEFDRKGSDDAVFYDCENLQFIDFILEKTGYKFQHGAFTDICEIMEAWDVAGVNLSCGYYNAHTLKEYVVIDEMLNTINVVHQFLEKLDFNDVPHYDAQLYSYNTSFGYSHYEEDDTYLDEWTKKRKDECYCGDFEGEKYFECDCGEIVNEEEFTMCEGFCKNCFGYFYHDEDELDDYHFMDGNNY